MFGLSDLTGEKQFGIPLSTSKGTSIENTQGAKVAIGKVIAFRDLCQKRNWTFRRKSDGLYNCAGLVWASRRTGISEAEDWNRILDEDGYRKTDHPKPDDLVLYFEIVDKAYLHVGRIVRVDEGIAPGSKGMALVLSKWGHDLGECFHYAQSHGFSNEYTIKIEFWTERPEND